MHVIPALVMLLLAPAAFAADAARGEVVFNAQCSLCHEARAPEQGKSGKAKDKSSRRRRWAGPNLAEVLGRRTSDEVRSWLAGPWKQKADTSCDTRNLTPETTGELLAFLTGRSMPLPPPAEVRQRQSLEKRMAERRSTGGTRSPVFVPHGSTGKKKDAGKGGRQ